MQDRDSLYEINETKLANDEMIRFSGASNS